MLIYSLGNFRCFLLLRMHPIRERSRWLSKDYQFGELKNRSILSKENIQESLESRKIFGRIQTLIELSNDKSRGCRNWSTPGLELYLLAPNMYAATMVTYCKTPYQDRIQVHANRKIMCSKHNIIKTSSSLQIYVVSPKRLPA